MVLQSLLQMLKAILRGGDWFVSVPVYLDTNSLHSLLSLSLSLTRTHTHTHTLNTWISPNGELCWCEQVSLQCCNNTTIIS